MTPKEHAVFEHELQFCQKHAKGLGYFFEQASESAHCDFSQHWVNYRVPEQHPQFPAKLLQAVISCNSFRIVLEKNILLHFIFSNQNSW